MAGVRAVSCLVLLVFGCASAQMGPEVIGCTQGRLNSATYMYSHNDYCDMFFQCDSARKANEAVCAQGTVFDMELSQCNHIDSAKSHYCNCEGASTYPSVCCDSFYQCRDNKFLELVQCDAGQMYNALANGCVEDRLGECQDYKTFCHRNNGTAEPQSDFVVPCEERKQVFASRASDGDVCHFNIINPLNRKKFLAENLMCGEGTGFDDETCTCGGNDECTHERQRLYKAYDENCGASMQMTFENGASKTVEFKSSPGVPTPRTVFISNASVSATGNTASFRRDSNGAAPFMYLPVYAGNELRQPLAIAISFRVTGTNAPNTQTFSLLRNERADYCQNQATLSVTGSVQNSDLTVQVKATGKTEEDVASTATASGSVRLNGFGGQGFVKLVLTFDQGQMSGKLYTDNGSQPTDLVGQDLGSVGTHIEATECGFEIGSGMAGELKEFTMYEGCGAFDRINTTP